MPTMTGGQAVVECIRRAGVTHAFCVPGESFLAVLDAFYDTPEVTMIATRHEEGAGMMAEAYARMTGRPGIAMATRGPGLTHLAMALHIAQQDSTPLVAFLGQVNTDFRHREAFQEVEMTEFCRTLAKWSVEIREVERTPELVQRALRTAVSGRPGPVLVSLPEDVIRRTAEMTFTGPPEAPRPRPGSAEVARAAALLAQAGSVAILAGLGVLRAGATPELVALAEALGAPVFTAFRRYDAFPNQHPLYLGGAAFGMRREVFDPLRAADVVLAVGTRLSEITTLGYSAITPRQQLIHIDLAAEVIGSVFPPAVGMVADAKAALTDLLAALGAHPPAAGLLAQRRDLAARARARFEQLTTPRSIRTSPVDPEGVVHDLNRLLPPETIIVTDSGNFSGWFNRFYRFPAPGTLVANTAGAMGYGVPAAIGAKLARPDRPVLCAAGDGGFAMTMSEVQTAVRLGLQDVVVLVFNNGMYGTIRGHQEKHYPGRPVATDLGELHFARVAEGLGAYGERLTANDQLPAALARARGCGRPAVLELMVRPERLSAWAESAKE